MTLTNISIQVSERLLPRTPLTEERVVALSVLDATTAEFGTTNAIWLFEKPTRLDYHRLTIHLKASLQAALDAYPQWCGRLKYVTTIDGTVGKEAGHLPLHARRFGRFYSYYGTAEDPGIQFTTASSSTTFESLYPPGRTTNHPLWNRQDVPLSDFMPTTALVSPLRPDRLDEDGLQKPLMAIQITELAEGEGFALAVKSTHPMADISALVTFVKDWARLSSAVLLEQPEPVLSPTFEPLQVDSFALGDINSDGPDEAIIKRAKSLPLHRYDWWDPEVQKYCPWPVTVPAVFQNESLLPAGKPMPWAEWDLKAPVSNYTIHLSRDQVEYLWKVAKEGSSERISYHDAVLAHVWSCITRARGLEEDGALVHCDLVYGLRPALKLDQGFMGSPIIMVNIEFPARSVSAIAPSCQSTEETASTVALLPPIAQKIKPSQASVTHPTLAHTSTAWSLRSRLNVSGRLFWVNVTFWSRVGRVPGFTTWTLVLGQGYVTLME